MKTLIFIFLSTICTAQCPFIIAINDTVCAGDTGKVVINVGNVTSCNITDGISTWSLLITASYAADTVKATTTTIYTITTVGSPSCGVVSQTVGIFVYPYPVISVNSITICSGQSGKLKVSAAPVTSYSWSGFFQPPVINGAVNHNILYPNMTTAYTFTAINWQCITTRGIQIYVHNCLYKSDIINRDEITIYDLSGRKVNKNTLNSGIYIEQVGEERKKIIVIE